MSNIPKFAAYAAAFERAYESDDWSSVKEFFADDAVYEIGLPILGAERVEGSAAIAAWFKDVTDRFDRCFETRELTLLQGPKEQGDEVWILGTATYQAQGAPTFVLKLEETVRFDGDRIVHLEDCYAPEMRAEAESYLQKYGEKLGIREAGQPA